MSGGHFDYVQHRIANAAEQLGELISSNDDKTLDEWSNTVGHGYKPETIAHFAECKALLDLACTMLHRIDWLVSCDDSEDGFHRRLKEDIDALVNSP